MACNWYVITCHYMHYMSLHATEDANALISPMLVYTRYIPGIYQVNSISRESRCHHDGVSISNGEDDKGPGEGQTRLMPIKRVCLNNGVTACSSQSLPAGQPTGQNKIKSKIKHVIYVYVHSSAQYVYWMKCPYMYITGSVHV